MEDRWRVSSTVSDSLVPPLLIVFHTATTAIRFSHRRISLARHCLFFWMDAITHAPARHVRTHFTQYIRQVWQHAERRHKFLLIFLPLFHLILALVSILIAALAPHCDQPLQIYLSLHGTYCLLAAPVHLTTSLTDTDHAYANSRLRSGLTWIKRALELFALVVFILGNIWTWSSTSECRSVSPELWWTSVSMLILSYMVLLVPAMWIVGIIFCLPCVVVLLHQGYQQGRREGGWHGALTEKDLETLDAVQVTFSPPSPPDLSLSASNSIMQEEHPLPMVHPPKPSWKTWFNPLRSTPSTPSPHSLSNTNTTTRIPILFIHDPNDAQCPICLEWFEQDQLIRKLPCTHLFHIACSNEWLRMNGKCPLCKQDVLKQWDRVQQQRNLSRAGVDSIHV